MTYSFQVFGDVIHSCPKHTDPLGRHALKRHLTNNDEYENSMVKICDLEKMSPNAPVKVVWECEIKDMLKESAKMRHWFEEREEWKDLIEPIKSRDALHGGFFASFFSILKIK